MPLTTARVRKAPRACSQKNNVARGRRPSITVVLINRPEIAPSGAGEPSTRTVPAAIANAIFDAIGVRLRKVPLTRSA